MLKQRRSNLKDITIYFNFNENDFSDNSKYNKDEKSKRIMQMEHPQCLFQVLEFNDMEQYKAFAKLNDETEMPYTQVGSRMMALRLSCCIQFVEIRQDNANDIYKQVTAIEMEAAKWYNEFLNQK